MKTVNPKTLLEPEGLEFQDKWARERGNNRQFRFLLLYFLISIFIHGLLALIFARSKIVPTINTKKPDNKPIEFIVVPPDKNVDKPPPETKRRAAHNSILTGKSESKKPPATDKPVNTETNSIKPSWQSTAKPEVKQPISPPKPTPTVSPEVKPSTLSPQTNPTQQPEVKPNIAKLPKPEAQAPNSSPKPIDSNKPSSVATAIVPPTNSNSSAANLLGGSYQRSLKEDAGSSFFKLEANASKEAPYANLDAVQDDLAPYFAEIRRRVKRNWQPSSPGEEQLTVLSFAIQRNGQITGLRIIETSGNQKVDLDALEAVQNSAPFAPLPASFTRDRLDIQFNFNIYVDRGFDSFP